MQGLLRRRREESGCGENGVRIKTRSRLGPPCYALHRSSPRSMKPRTPLNAATMRLVLRYVGIDAHSKACSFHDNTILILLIMRPLTAINCRLQLRMSSAYEKWDTGTNSISSRLVRVGECVGDRRVCLLLSLPKR